MGKYKNKLAYEMKQDGVRSAPAGKGHEAPALFHAYGEENGADLTTSPSNLFTPYAIFPLLRREKRWVRQGF